jgi:hypothetical protein
VADFDQSGNLRPTGHSAKLNNTNNLRFGSLIAFSQVRSKEMRKGLLILGLAVMTIAPSASAAVRVFVGHPYYGGFYRPYWGPYWGPYYGGYYYEHPNAGEVKLDTKVKDAQVFINGAYAGTTHENKSMHLRPGTYNIEIREGGRTPFAEKVYVVAGKTLHLHPEL